MRFELKVHIIQNPMQGYSELFLYDTEWGNYTIKDGLLVRTLVDREAMPVSNPIPTMKGPHDVIMRFAELLAEYVSKSGGINQEQRVTGMNERLLDETNWLRGLVEKQMK